MLWIEHFNVRGIIHNTVGYCSFTFAGASLDMHFCWMFSPNEKTCVALVTYMHTVHYNYLGVLKVSVL